MFMYVEYKTYFECAHKIVFTSNVFLLDLANCTVLLHTLHFYIEAWGVALLWLDQTLNAISIALVSTSALYFLDKNFTVAFTNQTSPFGVLA